jgi:phage terminase large subunit GpA-like protein
MTSKEKILLVLKAVLKTTFKPLSKLPMWEWCEKNIYLAPISAGSKCGPYSLKNHNHLKEIYNSIENPLVRKVVISKSVQSGLSTLAQNVMLWYVCNRNVPITYFTFTKEMALGFAKNKLIPAIEDCKELQQYRSPRDDDETLQYIQFSSCRIKLGYAGSIGSLTGDPATLVILDEVSKWTDSKTEAKSYEEALSRTITSPLEKKQILLSSPAEESTCVITKEYLTGDQRVYQIPSPYTGQFFEITMKLLKKPDDCIDDDGNYNWYKIANGTWLEDPTTRIIGDDGKVIKDGKPIWEHQKAELFRKGKWVATCSNPRDPDCHSYKVSSLYTLDVAWGLLLRMWMEAKENPEKLIPLNTKYLGQCWKHIANSVRVEDVEKILDISPDYTLGYVPEYIGDNGMLLGAIDQQLDHYYYVVQALCENGNSYVVDYGKIICSLDGLRELLNKPYYSTDRQQEYYCKKFLIDEGGFVALPVRDLSVQTAFEITCCKGISKAKGEPYVAGVIEHPPSSKTHIPYIKINDDEMKKILLLNTIKYQRHNLYFPKNITDDFKEGITNEEYVETSKGNFEWRRKGPNHYLDCMKYIEALKDFNRRRLPMNVVSVDLTTTL